MAKFFSNYKKQFKIKYYINYIVIAVFLVLMIILSSTGTLSRSVINILPKIGYSIILAISLNLIVGFLGELSLGHAGFMCVGAYIGCYVSVLLNNVIDNKIICFLISMVVGALVAAVFGFIIGLPALRLKGDYLAIVTLAFGEIVRNVFKNLEVFGGAMGLKTNTISIPSKQLFIITFILVLIILALIQNLIRSKHGRAITAIRDNEIAAKAMGINVTFYKLFVFVIAAAFAGIAGVIYGHYITPVTYSTFDFNYSIEILVMVVIGGIGSLNGSIIAATLITYVNFLLQNKLSGNLAAVRLLVYALILILVIIFSNAPALKPLKEKLSIKRFLEKLFKKSKEPHVVKDDDAAWNRIESKIRMDEVLSVDVKNPEGAVAEKGDRAAKKGDK